ncbi:MAG: GMC family oxidoreductase [Trueperaceae bacterium]|nr:GMC family oxidoreductase [Trueperaceae bacterium]
MSAFLDARGVEAGTLITTDICVIGAGAAGITIARDLAGSRNDVYVVESGDLELEAATQELAGGENVGRDYASLITTRLRSFGGTTNHWAGWCAPLDALDFEHRDWVPESGWPIGLADLLPYYERAQRSNELAAFEYGVDAWASRERPEIALEEDFESIVWQFSPPTRYGQVYRDELERAPNVHVLLNANLTGITTTDAADHVEEVTLTTLAGTSFRLAARYFVIACGGIENARVLLLANDVERAGLGNRHDLVGRYFMEHPHVTTSTCVFVQPEQSVDLYASRSPRRVFGGLGAVTRVVDRLRREVSFLPPLVPVRAGLRVSGAAQRRDGILNAVAVLGDTTAEDRLTADVQQMISVSMHPERDPVRPYDVRLQLEQAPNPDSRVTLGDDRDALGQRTTRLDWRLNELDERTMVQATWSLGRALGLSHQGRLRLKEWVMEHAGSWEGMYGGSHHMGTTRMSQDPTRGVVDSDCRVHGVGNLYVAGSSVFPTGGCVNPTLTLTALAHRLADHLRDRASAA